MFRLYGKDETKKILGEYSTEEECNKALNEYQKLEKELFKENTIEFYIEEVK